jgi:radical SAM superfamily enzyme YgiQ (UPF0313 family)
MEKIKIHFYNPPFSHFPTKFSKTNYTEPPLSILYLSSYLREFLNKNIEIKILDLAVKNREKKELLSEIEKEKPEFIGITTTTLTACWTKDFIEKIKKISPSTITVVGGPHPTVLPSYFENSDFVVQGEGERAIYEIINNKKKEKYIREEQIRNLDEIPYPSYDLIDISSYTYSYPHPTKNELYCRIITSRGCPFNCSFCQSPLIWGRKVRYRSVENVLGEIELLVKKYNVSFIFFSDDTFVLNKERVRKLCEEIIRRKIEIFWGCLTRANNIDFSLLQIMKKAGCREVQIGVESGDEEVLKSINKNITLKEIEEAFKILKKVGINTKGFFILGHPKDTPKTIKKTINFALKLSPTYAFFSIFTPYPGLPVYEEYKRKGYLKTEDFSQFNYHSYPVFETENLKRETLIKLKRSAEIKFYLHPKRIFFYLKEIIRSKKIKKMWKNFLIFLDLIR